MVPVRAHPRKQLRHARSCSASKTSLTGPSSASSDSLQPVQNRARGGPAVAHDTPGAKRSQRGEIGRHNVAPSERRHQCQPRDQEQPQRNEWMTMRPVANPHELCARSGVLDGHQQSRTAAEAASDFEIPRVVGASMQHHGAGGLHRPLNVPQPIFRGPPGSDPQR